MIFLGLSTLILILHERGSRSRYWLFSNLGLLVFILTLYLYLGVGNLWLFQQPWSLSLGVISGILLLLPITIDTFRKETFIEDEFLIKEILLISAITLIFIYLELFYSPWIPDIFLRPQDFIPLLQKEMVPGCLMATTGAFLLSHYQLFLEEDLGKASRILGIIILLCLPFIFLGDIRVFITSLFFLTGCQVWIFQFQILSLKQNLMERLIEAESIHYLLLLIITLLNLYLYSLLV